MYGYISLGMLVPNSRDQSGKSWLPKKQKMVRNQHSLQIQAINLFLLSYQHHESIQTATKL